jgi:glycosyltransferase involved in cell wall biosynthesis
MNSPKVSVIIPIYNGERYIVSAIESVLAQTYKNFEIVIVNDGSTDNSREKLLAYRQLPFVQYIEQDNRGVAAARNTAIRQATGELIAFLDQDDLWLPSKLEAQVGFMRDHPAVPMVHANVACIDAQGQQVDFDWDNNLSGDCLGQLFQRNRVAVVTVVVKKECLGEVGLLDESLSGVDDYELWLRIARRFPIGRLDEIVACYRFHDLNTSRAGGMMAHRELAAIEQFVKAFPDVTQTIGRRAVSSRKAELHFKLGGWYMWNARDFAAAKREFLAAIKLRPNHLPSCRLFLWCALTPEQRKGLQWYWFRLKGACVSKPEPPNAHSAS